MCIFMQEFTLRRKNEWRYSNLIAMGLYMTVVVGIGLHYAKKQ